MTWGKTTAVALGVVGAFALGVWTGPYLTERGVTRIGSPGTEVAQPSTQASPGEPSGKSSETARASRGAPARTTSVRATAAAIPPSAPELQMRLKPLLNAGTNLTLAAEGFRGGEQFATLVHAARNTSIPFMVLKHRVLNERKTLADAIAESKPHVNAAGEARRARAQARLDIEALRG